MLFRVTFDTKRGMRYIVEDAQWFADSLEASYQLIREYSADNPQEFFATIDTRNGLWGEWSLIEDGVHNEDPNLA
jgi:hypothetical protein